MREFSTNKTTCPKCGGELVNIKNYNEVSLKDLLKEIKEIPSTLKTETLIKYDGRCVRCGKETKQVSYIKFLLEGGEEDIFNLETICNDCLKIKHKVRTSYHKLNSLDDDLLNLIFFTTDVYNLFSTREEKIIYISENEKDIDSLISDMEYKFSFVEKLNDFDSDFEEIEQSFNIPKELTNFKDKVYYLILHASTNELEGILNEGPYLNKFIDYLESLDVKIFDLLCKIFDLDSSKSKSENIENLVSYYSTDEIELEIVFIELKLELFDELLNLGDATFKNFLYYLGEDDSQDSNREEIVKSMLNDYENSKDYDNLIKFKFYIDKAQEKTTRDLFFKKINDLYEKVFYYLTQILNVPDLASKDAKINQILENNDYKTINWAINKAFSKFEIYNKLCDLEPFTFELMSDELNISSALSEEEKYDYIALNYEINDVEQLIKDLKIKINLFNRISNFDDRKLKYLHHFCDAKGKSKEEKIKNIVQNNSKKDLDSIFRKISTKIKQADGLKGLDQIMLDYLFDYYNLDSDLSIEDKSDYLILNHDKREINKVINLAEEKLSIYHKLIQLDDRRLKYLYHFCDAKGKSKEEKINYILKNSFEDIPIKINEIESKLMFANKLENLEDYVFNWVFKSYSVQNILSKVDKCDYLVLNFDDIDIDKKIGIAIDRYNLYKTVYDLNDKVYEYLLYELGISDLESKEEQIDAIIDSNSDEKIDAAIMLSKSRYEYAKKIRALESGVFDLLCKYFSVNEKLEFEEKIDYLVLNFDNTDIYNKICIAIESYYLYKIIYDLNDKVYEYLLYELGIPDLESKEEQIDAIIDSNSEDKISSAIMLSKSRYEYAKKIRALDDNIFDILCENLSVSGSSKDDKIDDLLFKYDINYLKSEKTKIERRVDLFNKLNNLDNRLFKILEHKLSVPDFESKEDKINYILDNNIKEIPNLMGEITNDLIFSKELEELDDYVFNNLSKILNVPDGLSKVEKCDYIVSYYTKLEISTNIRKSQNRFKEFSRLKDLDGKLFDYSSFILMNESDDSKEICQFNKLLKEEKTDYLLDNYTATQINDAINLSTEKLKLYDTFNSLKKNTFTHLSLYMGVPDYCSTQEEKIDYLVLNNENEILMDKLNYIRERMEVFERLDILNDKTFSYLEMELNLNEEDIKFDSSYNLTDREEKIHYILLNKKGHIFEPLSKAENKNKLNEKLNSLKDIIFNVLCDVLMVPKEGYAINDSRENKIDYLISNYSIPEIEDEIGIIEKIEKIFIKLDFKDNRIVLYFKDYLNLSLNQVNLDKESKIKLLFKNNSNEDINKTIERINEKLSLFDKLDHLMDSTFKLLILDFHINDSLSKKEKIDCLVNNFDKEEINKEIEFIKENIILYNEISEFEDKKLSLLFKDLADPGTFDLNEEKIWNILKNNTISKIQKCIDLADEKLNLYNKICLFDNLFLELFCNRFDINFDSKNQSDKEEAIFSILLNFTYEMVQTNYQFVLDKIDLSNRYFDKIISFSDKYFNQFFNEFDLDDKRIFPLIDFKANFLSKEKIKERKTEYVLFNNEENKINGVYELIYEKENICIKLKNLNNWSFDHACFKLNIHKKNSKEETIDNIIETMPLDMINDIFKQIEIRKANYYKLKSLDEPVFAALTKFSNVPSGYIEKNQKINYLLYNFSANMIEENISSIQKDVEKITNKLSENEEISNYIFDSLNIDDNLGFEEKLIQLFKSETIEEINKKILRRNVGNRVEKGFKGLMKGFRKRFR